MRMKQLAVMLWIVLGCATGRAQGTGVGLAQSGKPTVVPEGPGPAERPTDRRVPLLPRALRLEDFAGMVPRADLREHLTEITGFTQNRPTKGTPASEQTEVWVGRTSTVLYVAFMCHDHRPADVRAHMARRENIFNDDNVSVLLDPFEDRRKGVTFSVNPYGVQADGAYTEGNGTDYSYDTAWDSEGRVTDGGWMALMAIPFRSLRFRPGSPGWGVVFSRNLPRNSEHDSWPVISPDVQGQLTQEATLRGIEGVTGSRNVQVNPYGLAQNEHRLDSRDATNPHFSTRKLEGTAGGEIKAIVKESIVIDATVNPDFSDVESDQPQFTVNQRYPVYFPELRPFFLENANYFATPIGLVYTRNIAHPEFGARVTGKLGGTNLGLFASDDRAPGEGLATADPLYGKRALFAVGRVSQDLGKGSSVGVIYTDEELAGSWNRIGGVDYTARLSDKWTSQGQVVESSTRGIGQDGSYSAGPASNLEFTRNGHAFNFDTTLQDNSSGFQSRVGFVRTTNLREASNHVAYGWFPKHGLAQTYHVELNNNIAFDHQGNRVFRYTQFDLPISFARNTVMLPLLGENSDTLLPLYFPGLTKSRNLTQNFAGGVIQTSLLEQLSFNLVATYGGNPNYNPLPGVTPLVMNENFVQASLTVQPLRALTIDNTYLLDRNRSRQNGALVFENQVLRTKFNYQFTRAFSARVIAEYDSLLANPAETSLHRTKQVATQALFTWLPHPGTAIYVGYNSDLQNLDRGLCSRLKDGSCDQNRPVLPRGNGYLGDGRQVFVKVSYLLRF